MYPYFDGLENDYHLIVIKLYRRNILKKKKKQ